MPYRAAACGTRMTTWAGRRVLTYLRQTRSLIHCKLSVVKTYTRDLPVTHANSLSCAVEDLPFFNVDPIVLVAGPTFALILSYTAVLVLVLELPSEILIPALAMASISDVGGESYSMFMSSS